jgi:hypothetical protein
VVRINQAADVVGPTEPDLVEVAAGAAHGSEGDVAGAGRVGNVKNNDAGLIGPVIIGETGEVSG